MELGAMAWTELDEPIVVVPVGSCEQHGPHLPIGADTLIATALAHDLVARRGDCVLAPAIAITASGEHRGFPGTLSIGTEAMVRVVVEIARSADWAAGVVLVNGHGGNREAMDRATAILDREDRRVLVWWPHLPGADLHAGRTETSLLLALAPEQVRVEHAVPGPSPAIADLIRLGVRALSESGVLGDPSGSTAAEGASIFARLTDQLADAVADWVG